MTSDMKASQCEEQRERLVAAGQHSVLRWWDELEAGGRARLAAQVARIDLEQIAGLVQDWQRQHESSAATRTAEAASVDTPAARASRAEPPTDVVRLPQTDDDRAALAEARETGESLLRAGRVAGVLVAGGQGTRLRFPRPKGMFPIGPVSDAMLFQILAEQIQARGRRYGVVIPWLIMTSDTTHDETVACFAAHDWFGLDESQVHFFLQGSMPAIDAASGQLLLEEKDSLCLTPDGHGGILSALDRSGLMQLLAEQGIDFLHYHQVDNPTVVVCDPALIGWHVLRGSEMTTKVAVRRSGLEPVGVVAEVDGCTQIIEYSDMPEEVATSTDASGNLRLWAGNLAIHVLSRTFLEGLLADRDSLPLHVAHKAVAHLNEQGQRVQPESPNALKFERFIFDALPKATRALVVEIDRAVEFNPVKNATGVDTPEESRAGLLALHRRWLEESGAVVDDGVRVEISPLFAVDADEVRQQVEPGTRFTEDVYLRPQA